jgi:hypothetical protein
MPNEILEGFIEELLVLNAWILGAEFYHNLGQSAVLLLITHQTHH